MSQDMLYYNKTYALIILTNMFVFLLENATS